MMMMMAGPGPARVPGGFALPPSIQPLGVTPDAGTILNNPGVYYRPFNGPDGAPLGLYKTGLRNDGFILGNGQQFFDGNNLFNRRVGSEDVTAAINNIDFLGLQGDQWLRWQQGVYPFPPDMNIPQSYPPMPGTPSNPFGGLGGVPFGGVNGAQPSVPQQNQNQASVPNNQPQRSF